MTKRGHDKLTHPVMRDACPLVVDPAAFLLDRGLPAPNRSALLAVPRQPFYARMRLPPLSVHVGHPDFEQTNPAGVFERIQGARPL